MNFVQSDSGKRNGISLTPLIDVVFILLMFFMLTTQFFRTGVLDIAVSSAVTTGANTESDKTVRIFVRNDGKWQIDEQVFDTLEPSTVTALKLAESVQIVSELQARLQDVVSLLDALSQVGITDAIWLTDSNSN